MTVRDAILKIESINRLKNEIYAANDIKSEIDVEDVCDMLEEYAETIREMKIEAVR